MDRQYPKCAHSFAYKTVSNIQYIFPYIHAESASGTQPQHMHHLLLHGAFAGQNAVQRPPEFVLHRDLFIHAIPSLRPLRIVYSFVTKYARKNHFFLKTPLYFNNFTLIINPKKEVRTVNKTAPTEEKIYLTRYHVGRPSDENRSVVFVNEETGATQLLIDSSGHILNFSGIDCSDLPKTQQFSGFAPPVILYEASFERVPDGRFIMIWTVQPDGRHWMDDDGFGDEDQPAIALYTFIDEAGRFTAPFRLYRIGYHFFTDHRPSWYLP